MKRVVVVGGPGSGKSTVAALIAEQLGARHIELDALWWGPSWTPIGRDELRRQVGTLSRSDRWVIDGNYIDDLADQLWPLADTIVWLDLPRRRAVARAVVRSVRRQFGRRCLWNGNRESLRVLSPLSILGLARRWPQYPLHIAEALVEHQAEQTRLVRLASDIAVQQWLAAP